MKFNNSMLRVNKIYDYDSHYGIVFGDDPGQPLTKKSFQTCMRDYIAEKKADFYKTVETHTTPLKVLDIFIAVNHYDATFLTNHGI